MKSNGRREQVNLEALLETMQSLNEKIIKAKEEKKHINATIL